MSDSTLYLYTSLTAGSSHIVTATARIETILKANKLPFRAIDVATDEAARKLWGRRSKGKKLPGLVKYGNIVGDLEEIEEWNEFGELRMVVNSVQDLDGMPATSNPLPADSQSPASPPPKEPEPATPKPSTIKIQSPPTTRPEETKNEQAVLALRQASAEAASKAKSKSEEGKASQEDPTRVDPPPASRAHRGSVAPEMPDTSSESPEAPKRPSLVPEVAAVSTANFHAENAEALGLVEHHRGSIISATDKEEQDKVVKEIRSSISASEPAGDLDALRKEAAEKPTTDTIEESHSEEEAKDVPVAHKGDGEKTETPKESKEEETTAKQDPKSAEDATTSVQD